MTIGDGLDFTALTEHFKNQFDTCRNVTFVDTDRSDAYDLVKKWGDKKHFFGIRDKTIREHLSHSHASHGRFPLIVIDNAEKRLFSTGRAEEKRDILVHEVGHLVTQHGYYTSPYSLAGHIAHDPDAYIADTVLRECAADLFCSIYGLCHGWKTKEDISRLSMNRALRTLLGDVQHASCKALDDLVQHIPDHDWPTLSTHDMVDMIDKSVMQYRPNISDVQSLGYTMMALRGIFGDKAMRDYQMSDRRQHIRAAKNNSGIATKFYNQLHAEHEKSPPHSLLHSVSGKLLLAASSGMKSFLPPYTR